MAGFKLEVTDSGLIETKRLIEMATDIGIPTGAWFMVGMPGETRKHIDETVDFARGLRSLIIEVNIATPWPDTGFYYTAKKNNWLVSEIWSDYNEKKKSFISTPFLSDHEVVECFEYVLSKMISYGWRFEEGSNRLYHPNFLWMTVKMNIKRILSRGVTMSDINKLLRFMKIVFGKQRHSITESRLND